MAETRTKPIFARWLRLGQTGGSGTILATLFLLGTALFFAGCGGLPGDAAVSVNGTIINKSDVEARIDYQQKLFPGMVSSEDEANFSKIRRQATKTMVLEELQQQEAERRSITVSKSEVDDELLAMAEDSFLGDLPRMLEEFAGRGISEAELRKVTSAKLIDEKLKADVRKDISVSELDVQNYYEKNRKQYDQPELRQTREVIADSQVVALEAVRRVRAGESFIEVAKQLSVDPSAVKNGGNMGLVTQGKLSPELDSVLFNMSVGQISDPINVADKWYVLTVEAIQPGRKISLDEARAEITKIIADESSAVHWKSLTDDLYNNASLEFSPEYNPGLT